MATEELLTTQLAQVHEEHPSATLAAQADGTSIVAVALPLGPGWSQTQTKAEFVVPLPYPSGQPDCFYVPAELRLAGGAMPTNTGIQPLQGVDRLWFSWHLQQPWAPHRDTLLTYIRFIQERLRRAH